MKLINYNELLYFWLGLYDVDRYMTHMSIILFIIKKIFQFFIISSQSDIKYGKVLYIQQTNIRKKKELVNTSRIIVLFQLSGKAKRRLYIARYKVYVAKTNNDGFSQKHDVSLVVKYTKTHHQHMLFLIVLVCRLFYIFLYI